MTKLFLTLKVSALLSMAALLTLLLTFGPANAETNKVKCVEAHVYYALLKQHNMVLAAKFITLQPGREIRAYLNLKNGAWSLAHHLDKQVCIIDAGAGISLLGMDNPI